MTTTINSATNNVMNKTAMTENATSQNASSKNANPENASSKDTAALMNNHSLDSTVEEDSSDINQLRSSSKTDLSAIYKFLGNRTSERWIDSAVNNLPIIIQDHANCEKKAAGTAMNLMFRYEFSEDLQRKLAQLVREEMLHYEQVLGIMSERRQDWQHLSAGRYAKGMLKHKRTYEPAAMVDALIIGAYIEARSCERFAALAEVIEDERLAKYYRYLLKSESRHFEDYLKLAQSLSEDNIDERVAFFREVEADLIASPDTELRFHSGMPM